MLEALLKGATLGLLLNISVGPVIFSILKQSLNNGYRGGLSFIIGVSFSDIVLVLISNVFTETFLALESYRKEIGIIGSVFLITVGVYFLLFKKVKVNESGEQVFKFRRRDYVKIFLSGFFMNTLNPAVILFWLTTSTAFISHEIDQRIIIFITCLIMVFVGDFLKVMLAGKIRNKLTIKNIKVISKLNGLILIGFGIALIWGLVFYSEKLT
jgi:threonine/homoserine/homoserine lactone efflux protein